MAGDPTPKVVAIHSFRGGTGKSNTTANIAAVLAGQGRNVAVVDTDIQSPGVHVLFGLDQDSAPHTLNSFLWGRSEITDAAYDVTKAAGANGSGGRVWLVPSSIRAFDIARVMHDGYDVSLLNEGFRRLIKDLSLDALLLDTHPGLGEETLLSIAMAHVLVIILRPDQQDYEGTHVTVAVARKLRVPRMLLVVNKSPAAFDTDDVRRRVASAYNCEVAAVLPHSDDLMQLSSSAVFVTQNPLHPLAARYAEVAAAVLA